jgi:hypothetical protein
MSCFSIGDWLFLDFAVVTVFNLLLCLEIDGSKFSAIFLFKQT